MTAERVDEVDDRERLEWIAETAGWTGRIRLDRPERSSRSCGLNTLVGRNPAELRNGCDQQSMARRIRLDASVGGNSRQYPLLDARRKQILAQDLQGRFPDFEYMLNIDLNLVSVDTAPPGLLSRAGAVQVPD